MKAIGDTPAVQLQRLFRGHEVVAKLASMNSGGSNKDRMALPVAAPARRRAPRGGELVRQYGAALASAVLGLECDVTEPDRTSVEKVKRIEA